MSQKQIELCVKKRQSDKVSKRIQRFCELKTDKELCFKNRQSDQLSKRLERFCEPKTDREDFFIFVLWI